MISVKVGKGVRRNRRRQRKRRRKELKPEGVVVSKKEMSESEWPKIKRDQLQRKKHSERS